MPKTTSRLCERPKKDPDQYGFKPEANPLVIALNQFYSWINTRLGWRWGAVIVALFVFWINWDKVKVLPGVTPFLTRIVELRKVPRAQGDKFSILIGKLGNDNDGLHRSLIDDALRGRFDKDEIEVLLPDRTIPIGGTEKPQEAVKAGHERAREILREANANVMIWGEVLDSKTDAPMRLHWTVSTLAVFNKSSDKYQPAQTSYDLPELFWTDLSNVLSLLATSQGAAFSGKTGSYVADQLEPFIKRVRSLVDSGKLLELKQANLRMVLADGLLTFGEQRGDSNALKEAVSAYRDALKERTRERVPLDWAMTQNNLGNALFRLGERENGTERLAEAEGAYREALKERTRDRIPLGWAKTQNNLGNTLFRLGERESGTARLRDAVSAYRDALKEHTRERVPLDWATTQNNLGNALMTLGEREIMALGERENGTARLHEAVSAYQEALNEYTRERVPLDWAMTQNNLGNVFFRLGEREGGTELLEKAEGAYREALKERTRGRMPLDWAMTQNNLGVALETLGERESGTARLENAVKAYLEALGERTRDRVPLDWATTQRNLERAEKALATRNMRKP